MLNKAPTIARLISRQSRLLSALGTTSPIRQFRQIHNLHEVVHTANSELHERTAKYLERTDKVYRPSQTLEFNREGELLLWSCDNIRHSTVYFKYPYCTLAGLVPLSWYLFFINPFMWKWQLTLSFFYAANSLATIPMYLYWKSLDKKIHRMYLLRGGKYVRLWTMNPMGDKFYNWAHICEFRLLTENGEDFAVPADKEDFLTKAGQLKYEVQVQVDNYCDHAVLVQDEILYFMKEGTVHQPEVMEMVLKGYNIDTSDFVINTDHSVRFLEPTNNY